MWDATEERRHTEKNMPFDIVSMYQTPLNFVLVNGRTYDANGSEEFQFSSGRSDLDKKESMIQLTAFADGIRRVSTVIIRVRPAIVEPSGLQIFFKRDSNTSVFM